MFNDSRVETSIAARSGAARPGRSGVRILSLVLLTALALVIRLYRIGEPPLDFHPTRQYRSALIARRLYLEALPGAAEARVARAKETAPAIWEPPVMERLAASGYRVLGREELALPRVFSSLFWLAGGVFIYLAARRLASPAGAAASLGFFLLLPFAVQASRSFQPDPLMVALLASFYWALLSATEGESGFGPLAVGVLGAAAVLVKPVAIFQVAAGTAALWCVLVRDGRRSRAWLAAGALSLALIPGLWYYRDAFLGRGDFGGLAGQNFLPDLLLTAAYWQGWLGQIWKVTGFVPPLLALAGLALVRHRGARTALGSLWVGYLVFGLVFTYTVHTHDYYHLQLIPLVAIGLAAPVGTFFSATAEALGDRLRPLRHLPAAVLAVAALDLTVTSYYRMRHLDLQGEAETAALAGEAVRHSDRTIYLANYYGYPLLYHGDVGGAYWPATFDLRFEKLQGRSSPNVEDRLRQLDPSGTMRYFIVTFMEDFNAQPDLKEMLERSCAVVSRDESFVVFDLTARADAPNPSR